MVVAEVPLWVHHGGSEETKGAVTSSKTEQSLSLLLPNKTKKCAIYSVDVHPDGSKFATGGGDGTVRIWNGESLFQPTITGAHFDEETGAFVSSSDSGGDGSSNSNNSSGEEEEEEDDKTNGNKEKKQQKEKYTSSSSSSSSSEVEVHDLNAVARRKKDGSAVVAPAASPAPPTKQAASSTTTTTTLQSPGKKSPSRGGSGGHHHHHHHRLLCTLSAHTGSSVLSVRFSTTGQYLASAGDDACVCIYAPASSSSSTTAGNLVSTETKTVEHWSRIKLCRGHGLDVVDLAWAPDDSHLVSCSLDSATPIIVWKLTDIMMNNNKSSGMICNPFRVLGQGIHTSTVKGVTFDPAGSYFASSGDDPAVCIWRAHDDWGLEARIDADTGIFRKWAGDDAQALSMTQSLFRRLSWSTDGAFVCSTNSVVRNKHVASTIAREGWSVSGGGQQQQSAAGAANLVGHRQPVVVSRHARQLLNASKKKKKRKGADENDAPEEDNEEDESSEEEDENEDDEPEYATLLALGDRRGFVTIWSTRKSRPIFKLQCSESRCTVTDLSWGLVRRNGDLMLLVSLLDGQLVALRFSVPDELGPLLTPKETARVFQLRYGIDMDDVNNILGQRRLFVGGSSGPKLIENALQMTLEEDQQESDTEQRKSDDNNAPSPVNNLMPRSVKDQQQESRSQGKKRVRPVLMQVDDGRSDKRSKVSTPSCAADQTPKQASSTDPLQNAMEAADRASAVAESGAASRRDSAKATQVDDGAGAVASPPRTPHQQRNAHVIPDAAPLTSRIPHSTDRTHSVDLPLPKDFVVDPFRDQGGAPVFSAACTNVMKVPIGSKGSSIPCIDLALSQNGKVTWKDQIHGTSCSALASSRYLLAIGTSDGTIQFFGCSPALGWACACGFRSHPPLIFGQPIVSLQLKEKNNKENGVSNLDMVVVTGDGAFGVYAVLPDLALQYQGSIMPAMTHMSLGLLSSSERRLPVLSRIQITDVGRLFLLLSFDSTSTSNRHSHNDRSSSRAANASDVGAGGSVQAFVFEKAAKLWLRVSDSRFVLSDFYNALPSSKAGSFEGTLSRMDDAVRLGSLQSSLKASHRGRLGDRQADSIYNQIEDDSGNFTASRSHCEDRMACALAMNSPSEFKHWLSLYVRALCIGGRTSQLRMLVDMLLCSPRKESGVTETDGYHACWWLSSAPVVLELSRKSLVESVVLREMSKNRAMQRLTNEIALELDDGY